MLRESLLKVSRSTRIRGLVTSAPVTKDVVARRPHRHCPSDFCLIERRAIEVRDGGSVGEHPNPVAVGGDFAQLVADEDGTHSRTRQAA